jgi:hypothetical protein
MNLPLIALLLSVSICSTALAWDVDIRCCDDPKDFPECDRRRWRRDLSAPEWDFLKEKFGVIEEEREDGEIADVSHLRGSATDSDDHRQLDFRDSLMEDEAFDFEEEKEEEDEEDDGVDQDHRQLASEFWFRLKLHWERGFCWQGEWKHRKVRTTRNMRYNLAPGPRHLLDLSMTVFRQWCMECDGSSCGKGDLLKVQVCSTSEDKQKFQWIPLNKKEGRLKVKDKNLCWEQVSDSRQFKLQTCDSGEPKQRLVGFKPDGPFRLQPKGFKERCMSQFHEPKAGRWVCVCWYLL